MFDPNAKGIAGELDPDATALPLTLIEAAGSLATGITTSDVFAALV
jgi:hypothetical protein